MIIAIDPGLTGAIAFLDERGARIEDMPVADNEIDPAELANILDADGIQHVFIERVSSMPKQGVASTFKFGCGYGMIRGVVAAEGLPYTLVTAAKWKREMGLDSDKEKCRARAIQLFPKLADMLRRKKDHGRAEALLLAEYGRKIYK